MDSMPPSRPSSPPPASLPVLYLAGDVHLDADCGGAFPAFLDRLAQRPPARLVILGDLFDYWLETDAAERRYAPVLTRLKALRRAGWRLDLVRGNRELVAGRRLAAASGCRLHWPVLDLVLGSRHVRVVHGDRLCHDPGYRDFSALLRSFWWRTWQACHPGWLQDWVAQQMRRGSRAKARRRAAVLSQRPAVFIDLRRVRGAARGCDTLVAGHIHESWRRRLGGVDLILVGDWSGPSGRWVEGFADGRLEQVVGG